MDFGNLFGEGGDAHGGMFKRQTGGSGAGGSTGNTQSPFIKNKLYLIVVLVGLFLVLIAAIFLSFWCCKGAFENPCCCPCYLCACICGLECLECLACGLCAAGAEDVNV
ncbi:hypothetical protein SISSUDRAFT_1059834 [Sistotremastrum suecicum HHB10207 ss-3]|uniref:Uncharacterized protein n=1 Tax=Sistotremastrum suecicum HHB10207 ss-3 TaxID=1314776 RepID=A0A166FRP6_9AGAM|nr:hypothetical protein SISSUDRAFT_1059834 [Sistotremastrum suecicum HHB10207 ss-3]